MEAAGRRVQTVKSPMLINVPKGEPNNMIVSVDRINSDTHYSPEYVQLTCWLAKRWKVITPNDQFISLLEQVRNGIDGVSGLTEFATAGVMLPAHSSSSDGQSSLGDHSRPLETKIGLCFQANLIGC